MARSTLQVLLASMFAVTFAQPASADRPEGSETGRQGVVRCGGNNFLRNNGTEIQFTAWLLRNFNSADSIGIDRLRIWRADGEVLFDSANGGLPPTENGILGPANSVLGPNQTAQFNSDDIIPFLNDQTLRPIQLEIQWSASKSVLALEVTNNRVVRGRVPANGNQQEERSRSAIACRTIELRKGGRED
jgi:hypothetical protein